MIYQEYMMNCALEILKKVFEARSILHRWLMYGLTCPIYYISNVKMCDGYILKSFYNFLVRCSIGVCCV